MKSTSATSSAISSVSFRTKPRSLRSSMSVEGFSDVIQADSPLARYRPAAPIPEHIREHCHIYLDEQLYTSALTLLNDLVTSGASHPNRENEPVFAPVPLHIEIAACLLVHPRYTSQAPPNERTELAPRASTFLRNTLAILGPVNASFDEAFSFASGGDRTARRARIVNDVEDGASNSESEDGVEHMKGLLANRGRLRRCATDFWHVVGWAMNCSVKYPNRWKYWKVWLGFMLNVMDADWAERDRLDKEEPNWQIQQEADPDAVCQFQNLRKCLLLQYLSSVKGRSTNHLKRIVRAMFADASPESLKDFPEVFPNETSDIKHTGQKRKRGNRLGDYNDEEDDELPFESSEFIGQSSPATDSEDHEAMAQDSELWLGGSEAIDMRQKIISLLSRAAHYLPDEFIGLTDLYDVVNTCIYNLPLPAYALFTSSSQYSQFAIEVQVSLFQQLLDRILPNTAPQPHKVNKGNADDLSQIALEQCFLPFAAMTSSIQDNAKLSMLVENLTRLFLKNCDWEYTEAFGHAIEKGVLARQKKAKGDKRRKDTSARAKADESAMTWLKASGDRLMMLKSYMEQARTNA